MKYLILVTLGAFSGFVGAWLLFNNTARMPSMAEPLDHAPVAVQTAEGAGSASPGSPVTTTDRVRFGFDDIVAQPTVFRQQLVAWQLAAQQDDIEALEDLIGRCLKEPDPLYRSVIASVLMERYIELDPIAAMAYVSNEYRLDQDAMRAHVLTSWVRYDPEAALDYFRNINDERLKSSIGFALLQDPVLARTGLISEVESILGTRAVQLRERIELQQADPTILFESALSMTGRERQTRMMYAINRWIAIDPEAALERIRNLDPGTDYQTMLQVAVSRYAQRDPEAALDWTQLHEPDNVQLQTQIVGIMAQHDIDRALIIAEDMARRSGSDDVISAVVNTWSQNDPSAALAYIESLPAEQRRGLYNNMVHTYVRSYPRQGLTWALGLGEEFEDVKRSALHAITPDNMDIAEQALTQVTNARTRHQLITTIAGHKANADPDEALAWLSRYRQESAWPNAYQNVISTIANTDPARAAGLLDAGREDTGTRGAMSAIAHQWYRRDAGEALAWIRSLPNSTAKARMISSLAGSIAARDPDVAIDLVDELPEGDLKRGALVSLAVAMGQRQPDRIEAIIAELQVTEQDAEQIRRSVTNRY